MDPSLLQLILDEFNRRFDDFEARLDRSFSHLIREPRDAAADLRVGALQQRDVPEGCVSALSSTETTAHSPPTVEVASSATREQRVATVVFARLASADQIRNDVDANGNSLTSTVHDALLHTDQGRATGPTIIDRPNAALQELVYPPPVDITRTFSTPASGLLRPASEFISIALDAACASPAAAAADPSIDLAAPSATFSLFLDFAKQLATCVTLAPTPSAAASVTPRASSTGCSTLGRSHDAHVVTRVPRRVVASDRDRTAVDRLERDCEVDPSAGKLCLFTDLLGDPLYRVRHSPAFLVLVADVGLEHVLGPRVSPTHGRRGIGRDLVARREEWFRQASPEYAYVATDHDIEQAAHLFTSRVWLASGPVPEFCGHNVNSTKVGFVLLAQQGAQLLLLPETITSKRALPPSWTSPEAGDATPTISPLRDASSMDSAAVWSKPAVLPFGASKVLECGSADVRPLPWPSFTLSNCCFMSRVVCWKPPWPLQPRQDVVNTDAVEAEVYAVYLKERESVLKQVGNIPGRIILTVQSWATSQTLVYISLAGQFIDSEWKLHRRMLNHVMVPWSCSENAVTEAISRSLPWPPPLSTWIWFQLSANCVLSCSVTKLRLTIFHCVSCWESVHCSAYVQNFCQELIYLGSYTRGHVTVLPVLSRGKGFKFRMLNEDESRDAVLLVFASKPDLPNAMNAAEISDQLGLHSLHQRHGYIEDTCAPAVYFYGLAMEEDPPDAAQCITLQMQEPRATLQTQKHDGQGDAAWFTSTLQRQEHTADNEQGDTVQCTTKRQRQASIAYDTQGGSMQEAALLRNSAEATTFLTNKEVQ